MEPKYKKSDYVTIYQGDSLQIMKELHPGFDLAILDPPLTLDWIHGVKRLLYNDAVIFCFWSSSDVQHACSEISKEFHIKKVIPWIRGKGWTPIICAVKGDPQFRIQDVFDYKNATHKIHPAEKPYDLIQVLLWPNHFSAILDPYMGSGVVPLVAYRMKKKCVSVEINEAICERAIGRLKEER